MKNLDNCKNIPSNCLKVLSEFTALCLTNTWKTQIFSKQAFPEHIAISCPSSFLKSIDFYLSYSYHVFVLVFWICCFVCIVHRLSQFCLVLFIDILQLDVLLSDCSLCCVNLASSAFVNGCFAFIVSLINVLIKNRDAVVDVIHFII